MSVLESQSFDKPDETRNFQKGHMDLVTLGDVTMGRAVFEPGWKWSECVKPIAGTDSCEVSHVGYVISGALHVVMDDGTEGDAGPGDMFRIAPGHDAWTTGDEACVVIDIQGAANYAT